MESIPEVLTIGHSTLPYQQFLSRLRRASITAVADVRTSPYSRRFPHYDRDMLRDELALDGISYVYLGNELGGRPKEDNLYCEGIADYEKMAETADFVEGLNRVMAGARRYRICLMCSERDPFDCHRCLLVGRALSQRGCNVRHIVSDDEVVTQAAIEQKLLEASGRDVADMFASAEALLAGAYRDRGRKVAFAQRVGKSDASVAAE
jgi:uncharacterized protein (DUF488 family)